MSFLVDATKVFECDEKDISLFTEQDPFNTQNTLEGYLCHIQDHRYGALYIYKVNDKYKPQTIWATPKIHYPFKENQKGQRIYSFPPCSLIRFREKLDGTNIVAYIYTDGKDRFVTYKTRLTPTLKSTSKWGNWIKLWQIILDKYPRLPETVLQYNYNCSFEMYGSMNPHLVTYDTPLDTALLFMIGPNHEILAPTDGTTEFPVAKILKECQPEHLVRTYEALREEMNDRNKASVAQRQMWELEGAILNLYGSDGWQVSLFKCKPEQIEEIHFAAGRRLSKELVKQACWKVIEADLELTLELVKNEIERDFDPRIVDSFLPEIQMVLNEMIQYVYFREDVIKKYHESGLQINQDKGATMRYMSQHFPRTRMTEVYNILSSLQELITERG